MKARRRPIQDEYIEGGESAVLLDGRVIVLSPLATTILSGLGDTWHGFTAVAAELEDVHGAPPAGADLLSATRSALLGLAGLGLIEVASGNDDHRGTNK